MANLHKTKVFTSTPFAGSAANVTGLSYLPNVIPLNRAPTVTDYGVLGQLVADTANNTMWICVAQASQFVAGYQWLQITAAGGAAVFTSITTTVGPNSLAGVTTLGNGLIVTAGGAAITGGTSIAGGTTINFNTNANTAINTGTSNGTVAIGNVNSVSVGITGALVTIGNTLNAITTIGSDISGTTNIVSNAVGVSAVSIAATNAGGGIQVISDGNSATTGFSINNTVVAASIYVGTGAPNFAAPQSSLYLRTDGGANTHLYINVDSTNSWTAIASAA